MGALSQLDKILLGAVPVVFAITVHEVAHGWVANRLGDPTARLLGRLTLNPLRHVDLVGTVVLPLLLFIFGGFVFGWAKPVPVDFRNLRHPRRDMAIVAAAGPAANLGMVVAWALVGVLAEALAGSGGAWVRPLYFMVGVGITVNLALMVLNLLPLPPLDGSRVVAGLLPPAQALLYGRLERHGLLILLVLLATGVLDRIVLPPLRFLHGLVQQLFF